jgi:DNA-binding response OmpR family regulator
VALPSAQKELPMQTTYDILVIDDSEPIVDLIEDVLTDEGYTVRTALTPDDALQLVAEKRPDLVLLDLLIPGNSGNTLAHEINAVGLEAVPVIMMTANTKAAEELSMEGITHCLLKPFNLDELTECVAAHIRQSCTAT